ncbi:MAG: lytic transglycosylase domain-containing protein [Myxococcota bacterium]
MPPPSTIEAVIKQLGSDRPRLIDRGVALHAVGLEEEAEIELRRAERTLRRVRDGKDRTQIADLLHQLGAHYIAFRLAASVTDEGAELVDGEPWIWRAWRQSYPDAFAEEVAAAHEAHEVETNLVWAVMRTESNYRPWIRSPVGARGLMQLMPRTARAIGERAEDGRRHAARYRDPKSNVWLGAWYLKKLGERYDGQLAPTVGAYNAGPTAMDRWVNEMGGIPLDEFIERIPYKETRRYVRRVMESYFVYRQVKGLPLPELPERLAKMTPSGGVEF